MTYANCNEQCVCPLPSVARQGNFARFTLAHTCVRASASTTSNDAALAIRHPPLIVRVSRESQRPKVSCPHGMPREAMPYTGIPTSLRDTRSHERGNTHRLRKTNTVAVLRLTATCHAHSRRLTCPFSRPTATHAYAIFCTATNFSDTVTFPLKSIRFLMIATFLHMTTLKTTLCMADAPQALTPLSPHSAHNDDGSNGS
jgi:hypothetical protein